MGWRGAGLGVLGGARGWAGARGRGWVGEGAPDGVGPPQPRVSELAGGHQGGGEVGTHDYGPAKPHWVRVQYCLGPEVSRSPWPGRPSPCKSSLGHVHLP